MKVTLFRHLGQISLRTTDVWGLMVPEHAQDQAETSIRYNDSTRKSPLCFTPEQNKEAAIVVVSKTIIISRLV